MNRRELIKNIVGAAIAIQIPKFIPIPTEVPKVLPLAVGKAGQYLSTDGIGLRWITMPFTYGDGSVGTMSFVHNEIWDGPLEGYIKCENYKVMDRDGKEVTS